MFPDRPCPVCLAVSPEQRELASSARRLCLQRQKRKAAKASSRSGSVSGTAGPWEGDGVGLPRLTSFPTVAGQGGEEESVESGPLPIDESVASPRPTRSRVESKNTSRPRSRDDSSASSRSSPRDVDRRVRHSSPDSVAGQALPECRSRTRSHHTRSTSDRRSSVDRRATGRPVARSPDSRSTGVRQTPGRSGAGRSAVGDDIAVELRSTGDGTADTPRNVSRSRSLVDRVGWRDAPQPLSDQLGERLLQELAEVHRSNYAMAVRVAEMERRGVPSSAPVILPSVLSEREAAPALPRLLPTAVVDDSAESAINMEVDSYLSSSEEEVRSWRQPHLAREEDIGSAEEAPNPQRGIMRASSPPRDVSPSRTRDPEGGRYADILHLVYELNEDISPPAPRVDDTFGGKLFSRYQGNTKEEKTPALPLSGVMANAARHVTGVVAGVSRSPLAEDGRAREDDQRWGTHVSLSSPAIRQFKPDYYRVHYPDDIPEDERIYPHSNWSTASAAQISKNGCPADFWVKAVQMRDWEAMSRARLGILNHLDWFMSSAWTVLDGCPIEKDRQADIDKLMSASGIAVNQLAHIQMRSLASNATVRREAILESSVLDRQGALFLRSQPIGGTDLFDGRCAEALCVASVQKKNNLLFQATMGSFRKSGSGPSAGPSRIPPRSRRNKRKGGYSSSQRRAEGPEAWCHCVMDSQT